MYRSIVGALTALTFSILKSSGSAREELAVVSSSREDGEERARWHGLAFSKGQGLHAERQKP